MRKQLRGVVEDRAAQYKVALPPGSTPNLGGGSPGGALGGLLNGGLGGLLRTAGTGGVLSGGLSDLIARFQQAGHGDIANSWIGTGPNRSISPQQVEQALATDRVKTLAEQAGMPRDELLSGLSRELPTVVDKLTPEGRLPTADEASRWV